METIHFMQTDKGYQFLTSEAYDEREHTDIIRETTKELDKTEIEKIYKDGWEKVREYIKNILDKGQV